MDDLIAFYSARLDEIEAAARAVEDNSAPWQGKWEADGNHAVRTYNGHMLAYARTDNGRGGEFVPGLAAHIALHDPQFALADIAADRAILAMLEGQHGRELPGGVHDGRDPDEREMDEAVKQALEDAARIRAARFSGHPEYRPGWAA